MHVVHRGVNRERVFFTDGDRALYLQELRICAGRYRVAVHAYVLMDNHVHLLLTPSSDDGSSSLVRDLCRRYVPRANESAERVGTLWDGRHFSAVIREDRYLLACYRYIELNPVRAGLTRHAGGFRWSSHASNAFGRPDPLLTPHPTFLALGETAPQRMRAYERLFQTSCEMEAQCLREAHSLRDDLKRRRREERQRT